MTSWRYITDDAVAAAAGLARDESLMHHYGRGEEAQSPAVLRLYTYRSHCALVGRYQSVQDELDLETCEQLRVAVGRRPTGGGAIIMGAGQLGVAVTTRAPSDVPPREVLRGYAAGVVAGLARLGIDAHFRSKNDLEVGGRKIAGLGLYLDDRGALLFHASVLADLDVRLMLQVLRIPGAKLSDKAVDRVAERVTTVSRELRREVQGAEIRDAVAAGFREALGVELVPSSPDDDERERAAILAHEKYTSPDWVYQQSSLRDARGSSVLKTPEGLVRIYAGVHGRALSSVLVTGDFNVLPAGVARLEAALRWSHAEPDRIARIAADCLTDADLGVPPAAVAEAVWVAAERALQRAGSAAPERTEGSCYFPEPDAAGRPEAMQMEEVR